ncbi:hypothetical protein PPYR_02005 [Photinus pyralis]|uniref:EF-hand domain-containing protein n=1 Tax=Photinus pyralis TaxID=7054 RepID=A0A5N4B607_PHOPY|nr:EF-hand calcium-binding domain-containing protein 1-like [Photinus pyralis]KAB0805035.1 hypothetical protein PPYR_02005 [Photinus pyralis]
MSFGVHFDLTISPSEETRFINKHTRFIRRISNEYHRPVQEIVALVLIYYKFQCESKGNAKGMTKNQLREFLHNTLDLTDIDLLEFIASSLDATRNPTPIFPMERWVRSMLLFFYGNTEDRIDHCFKVYDRYQEGRLSRNNMMSLMKNSLIVDEVEKEDSVRDFVDLLTKRLDWDHDGIVSREDFVNYVRHVPLGLETFGQCLPNREAIRAFLSSFSPHVRNVK